MDLEREDARRQYRFCRFGFACIALGLGLLCLNEACFAAFLLTGQRQLANLVKAPWWDWIVGSPITWGTVLGAYCLWARSADPSWQRRAGVLLVMNLIDLLLWAVSHLEALGFPFTDDKHQWFRALLAGGMGWIEFMLFAGLAAELAAQLGREDAPRAALAARSVATIGLVFWLLTSVSQTDWQRGWPLERRPVPQDVLLLTFLGSTILTTTVTFRVARLCLGASGQCARLLAEMDSEDRGDDLLRSRSESGGDAPRHWFDEDDPWR